MRLAVWHPSRVKRGNKKPKSPDMLVSGSFDDPVAALWEMCRLAYEPDEYQIGTTVHIIPADSAAKCAIQLSKRLTGSEFVEATTWATVAAVAGALFPENGGYRQFILDNGQVNGSELVRLVRADIDNCRISGQVDDELMAGIRLYLVKTLLAAMADNDIEPFSGPEPPVVALAATMIGSWSIMDGERQRAISSIIVRRFFYDDWRSTGYR